LSIVGGAVVTALAASFLSASVGAQGKDASQVQTIPAKVQKGLDARFPNAEVQKWTKEKEGDIVIYDIEFTQAKRKYEVDIKEDGTIHNWERAVEARDLPRAVRMAAEEKYPGCTLKEIMAITSVEEGEEEMEGYEIVLATVDGKDLEITVAPDGRILEEPGPEK
jgi:uncharacterized membrane protein YkoI